MNKATSLKYSNLDIPLPPRFITQDEAKKMSKYRVIQKNLVHVQGFPDSIINFLNTFEYFGQFGTIIKLVIVKGKDEDNQSQIKKSNSAYITFSTNEEAAHAVLSVDSFYLENHLIRAFFGTSKYCVHFLNNKECYSKEKCMYLHALASETDVLGNTCGMYSKFDYSEHLQIALTISGVLNKEKKEKITKMKFPFTVMPNIRSIYLKDIVLQAEKRLHDLSSPLFSLLNSNNNGKGSGRTSTNDEDATSKSSGKFSENSDQEYLIYHYRSQSRFFNDNHTNNKFNMNDCALVPFYLIELIDKSLSRYSFSKTLSSSTNDYLIKQQEHILYDSWSDFNNLENKII